MARLLNTGPVAVITRLRLDAALYTPKPREKKGKLGRKRKKGVRLPTPQALIDHPQTRWQRVTVRWYSGVSRTIEIATGRSVWYHVGKPVVPIRWILIRDPDDEFEPLALLCTEHTLNPMLIVECFVQRWQLEVTFEEARAHLGLETQRQWSDLAIVRTTPALLGLFSWVTLAAHALVQKQDLGTASDPLGITSPCLLSLTLLPGCDSSFGLLVSIFQRHPKTAMFIFYLIISGGLCSNPYAMPPNRTKSS